MTRRPLARVVPVMLIVAGVFLFGHTVFAETTATDPSVVTSLFTLLASLVDGINNVLLRIMVAFLDVVMSVMTYNEFTNSAVVGAGWAIVRDTVNMFFVAALIYIAVTTMLGRNSSWQQQVPRLMGFAILINFSKLLIGLMVDAGQVVMLTFAGALRAIGAGNFLSVFALNNNKLSETAFTTGTDAAQNAGSAFGLFAGSIASLILTVAALVLVGVILAVLAYRIVAIWALTITAPMAWFVGGMGGLISKGPYEKWWSNFKCAVLVGPIVTFFLWLTLAVAAAGNVATSNGFITPGESRNVSSIAIAGFDADNLISFVIAFSLILVGLDAAQQVCAGSKFGFINSALGFAGRNASLGGAAALTGAAALQAARAGRGAGRVGKRLADRSGLSERVATAAPVLQAQQLYGSASSKVGGIKSALGIGEAAEQNRALRDAGSLERIADAQEKSGNFEAAAQTRLRADAQRKVAAEAGKKAQGDLANLGGEDKAKLLAGQLKSGKLGNDPQTHTLLAEALADEKGRKFLDSQGVLNELVEKAGGKKAIKNSVKGDKGLKEKFDTFSKSRPDLGFDVNNMQPEQIEEMLGEINSIDDIKKLDDKFLATIGSKENLKAAFEEKMKGMDSGFTDKNGNKQSVLDAFAAGRAGGKKHTSFTEGLKGYYKKMSTGDLESQNLDKLAEHLTQDMVKSPKMAQALLSSKSEAVKRAFDRDDGIRQAALGQIGIDTTNPGGAAVIDAKKLGDTVKNNPQILSSLTPQELSRPVSAAVGGALADKDVNGLMTKYKKATPEVRASMQTTMDRIQQALDDADTSTAQSDDATLTARGDAFRAQREVTDARALGAAERRAVAQNSALEVQYQNMTLEDGKMAAEAEQLNKQMEEIERQRRVEMEKQASDIQLRALNQLSAREAALRENIDNLNARRDAFQQEVNAVRSQLNKERVAASAQAAEDRSNQA